MVLVELMLLLLVVAVVVAVPVTDNNRTNALDTVERPMTIVSSRSRGVVFLAVVFGLEAGRCPRMSPNFNLTLA